MPGRWKILTGLQPEGAPSRHTFIKGNICDKELAVDLLREHHIEYRRSFCRRDSRGRSILDPTAFFQTNVIGTLTLLEAVRKVWLADNLLPRDQVRFHHVSTDEVYGSLAPGELAWSETAPYAPNSPYAASKSRPATTWCALMDIPMGCLIQFRTVPIITARGQFPEKLIPLMVLNALSGKPLPVYGDGGQIRDWLFRGRSLRRPSTRSSPGQAQVKPTISAAVTSPTI